MRALRFRQGKAAEEIQPGSGAEEPGGEVWLDLQRRDLAAGGSSPPHPWLRKLHPLTADALRRSDPRHLAAAQEQYIHVRMQAMVEEASAERGTASAARDAVLEAPRLAILDVVLGRGYALSVADAEIPAWDAVWRQLRQGDRRADSVDFALYHALAAVVAAYRASGERLTREAEGVDQRLLRLSEHHILREIVRVRRHALQLRSVLVPARDGLQLLAGDGGDRPVRPENRPYFADLRGEAAEAISAVEGVREAMGEAVEAFTSVQSTQMNRVMQLFTVLAVVIAPPMLVASIYGMNFRIPEYRWPHGYAYAVGLMFALAAGFYLYVRGRRWL